MIEHGILSVLKKPCLTHLQDHSQSEQVQVSESCTIKEINLMVQVD